MLERSSKGARKKRAVHLNVVATSVAAEAADEHDAEVGGSDPVKNPHAVALGRLGGKKGGPARAAKLTREQRKAIARKAAHARWANQERSPNREQDGD